MKANLTRAHTVLFPCRIVCSVHIVYRYEHEHEHLILISQFNSIILNPINLSFLLPQTYFQHFDNTPDAINYAEGWTHS